MSGIESMHRGPAIKTIAYKCGRALFTCDANQVRHKAVITIAVDGGGSRSTMRELVCRQRNRLLLRFAGEVGIGCVVFGCETNLGVTASKVPEVTINGRSEPATAPPRVSMARRDPPRRQAHSLRSRG